MQQLTRHAQPDWASQKINPFLLIATQLKYFCVTCNIETLKLSNHRTNFISNQSDCFVPRSDVFVFANEVKQSVDRSES
jgi:hypothetical protein